jgi:hypothetical protein
MLRSNAGLTDSHPYATGPLNWPFLASGISFWTGPAEELEQVYLIGNIIGWWICVMTLALFIGMIGADQFAQRRGLYPIAERTFPLKRAFPPFLLILRLVTPQQFEIDSITRVDSSCLPGSITTSPSSPCRDNSSFIIISQLISVPLLWPAQSSISLFPSR